jgi:SpoVK/Ycf46/Vps4 family AAA+-type ATPase
MAEKEQSVFVVATANDISALPPELVRKGRFDEIFFVDLPDSPARANILHIHLGNRGHDPKTFDLPALMRASEGFSGAEIEQGVVSAMYAANAVDSSLSTEQLLAEFKRTRPLSVVMREKIEGLRRWAAERTVPAD